VIQTAQTRPNPIDWVADANEPELPAEHFQLAEAALAKAVPNRERPSVAATVVPLEQGLYTLEIGEIAGLRGEVSGLPVPMVLLSAPPGGRDGGVQIIGPSVRGETWLGHEGGTVVVQSPADGGQVLVTVYGLPAQCLSVPEVDVRRLDRPQSGSVGLRPVNAADDPDEVRTEVVLHIERLGDRRFPGEGWIGNRGKKLRIEAFSIRPLDTLMARDIEFKALGPNRRQTPWVTDAKLCGTRGQRLPLTGFAVRLAPHAGERFDVVYQGSFFESGIVGPSRNGELCVSPIANDPLEALNLRVVRRAAR
jgi:hypothetical protein